VNCIPLNKTEKMKKKMKFKSLKRQNATNVKETVKSELFGLPDALQALQI
jgi:hypothetical protein